MMRDHVVTLQASIPGVRKRLNAPARFMEGMRNETPVATRDFTRKAPVKVLVVDDEPGVLSSTRLLLTELGYDVVTVGNASEALPVARREHPDVILQDIWMPRLDLDEHLARLREDAVVGCTPVILFSAGVNLERITARVEADGCLEKPFKPTELVQAIDTVMDATATGVQR
jgi:CheY-like chemotaxis protein